MFMVWIVITYSKEQLLEVDLRKYSAFQIKAIIVMFIMY